MVCRSPFRVGSDKGWLAAWTQPIGKQTSADFAYRRHTDDYIYIKTDPAATRTITLPPTTSVAAKVREDWREHARVLWRGRIARAIDRHEPGSSYEDEGGVYASFDARALKRFSFNVGVREELYTAGSMCSVVCNGAYWVNSRVKLRASTSSAFRLPDFTSCTTALRERWAIRI